jgi:hypothetical protein
MGSLRLTPSRPSQEDAERAHRKPRDSRRRHFSSRAPRLLGAASGAPRRPRKSPRARPAPDLRHAPRPQFTLGQGDNAVNAAAAAGGTTGSGNQALALSNYNQGLAGTTYNNYVSQLQPSLGAANSAASGVANVDTGLGSGLDANQNTLANLNMGANVGIGNAQASADLADQSLGLGLLGGAAEGLTTAIPGSSILGSLGAMFSDERPKEILNPSASSTTGSRYTDTTISATTKRLSG